MLSLQYVRRFSLFLLFIPIFAVNAGAQSPTDLVAAQRDTQFSVPP